MAATIALAMIGPMPGTLISGVEREQGVRASSRSSLIRRVFWQTFRESRFGLIVAL
jgi:hypothetical protein